MSDELVVHHTCGLQIYSPSKGPLSFLSSAPSCNCVQPQRPVPVPLVSAPVARIKSIRPSAESQFDSLVRSLSNTPVRPRSIAQRIHAADALRLSHRSTRSTPEHGKPVPLPVPVVSTPAPAPAPASQPPLKLSPKASPLPSQALPAFDNLSVAHQHVDNTAISIEMIETAATSTLSPSPMPRQLVSSASDPGLLDWKPVKPYSPSQDKLVSPRLVRQSTGVETVISEAAASLYSDAHNDDVAHDESAAPVVNRSASQCSIASDSFDPNSQSVNTFASLVSSVTSARSRAAAWMSKRPVSGAGPLSVSGPLTPFTPFTPAATAAPTVSKKRNSVKKSNIKFAPEVSGGEANVDVVLSVFFCGSDCMIASPKTLVEYFYDWTDAEVLDRKVNSAASVNKSVESSFAVHRSTSHFKLGFDGLGVDHGCSGAVFAAGMSDQCQIASYYVHELYDQVQKRRAAALKNKVARVSSAGRLNPELPDITHEQAGATMMLRVNVFGFSRGACSALMLAQMLAAFDSTLVLNLCLFDPVPGNLVCSSFLDCCTASTARQVVDVSNVKALNRVLLLFPYEPLDDLEFHAPIVPIFPSDCNVTEDVMLGCHQGALLLRPHDIDCQISFLAIKHFFAANGTVLSTDLMNSLFGVHEEDLLKRLDAEASRSPVAAFNQSSCCCVPDAMHRQDELVSVRATHAGSQVSILRQKQHIDKDQESLQEGEEQILTGSKTFLNKFHRFLDFKLRLRPQNITDQREPTFLLRIERPKVEA